MEFTGEQVLNASIALNQLAEQPLYVKSALKLRRTRRSVAAEAEMIEEERGKIVDKYAKKDSKGVAIPGDTAGTVKIDDIEAFTEEITELFEQMVEVKVEPVSVDDLGDIVISTAVLDLLMELEIIME